MFSKPGSGGYRCRECEVAKDCRFNFFHGSNYTVVRDIEDANDECFYDIPFSIKDICVTLEFENNCKGKIHFNLFQENSNRTICVTTKSGKTMQTCHKSQHIIIDGTTVFSVGSEASTGHNNGDLNFLQDVQTNHNIGEHTNFLESIQTFNLLSRCLV